MDKVSVLSVRVTSSSLVSNTVNRVYSDVSVIYEAPLPAELNKALTLNYVPSPVSHPETDTVKSFGESQLLKVRDDGFTVTVEASLRVSLPSTNSTVTDKSTVT